MDKKVVIVLFLCALAISSIISIDVAIARTDEQIKLPEPEIEGCERDGGGYLPLYT